MNYLVSDIETGPQDLEKLQRQMPEFEAAANLKDPEKIKASIEAKRQKWIQDAALSAESGLILAIGYKFPGQSPIIDIMDEASMLVIFWQRFERAAIEGYPIVGHNFFGFDWPFIIRRSWALGVDIPQSARDVGRYKRSPIYDTCLAWDVMGARDYISLDRFAKFLGVGEKNGSGADFAKLLASDPAKAREYLGNDLILTESVFLRITKTAEEQDDCPL